MDAVPGSGYVAVEIAGRRLWTGALATTALTIGRARTNGVALPHPTVSPRHAELRRAPGGLVLTDLGSTRGTFVGSTRLVPRRPVLLARDAVFRIGPYLISYHTQATGADELLRRGEEGTDLDAEAEPWQESVPFPDVDSGAQDWIMLPDDHPLNGPPAPSAASGAVSSYLRDLPAVFRESDFLGRFLMIFESLWEPLEQRQDHVEDYFDPRLCPAPMLPWLANWVGIAVDPHWPEDRARNLVAEAMDLYRWRGTRYGLARMIEVSTGFPAEVWDDPAFPGVFNVRVVVPAGFAIARDELRAVIHAHKPVHAGYTLEILQGAAPEERGSA